MKMICLVVVFLLMGSCKKAEDNGGSVVVDQSIKVSFVNQQNKDILKELGDTSIAKIRLYYLNEGKKTLYYDPKLSDPYGIKLIANDQLGLHQLRLFLNNAGTTGKNVSSTTYLVWEDGTEDTIVGFFANDQNNRILTGFKFNNVEGGLKEKESLVIVRD